MARRRYIPGKIVRRRDSLGRAYYVPRAGGRRVSAEAWRTERAEILRFQKEVEKATELGERPIVPETGAPGLEPFPPGVSPVGAPEREVWVDEDGIEWDVPDPVEGEDDT